MKEVEFPFAIEEFFLKCKKHGHLPKNDFEKQAVLLVLLREFKKGKVYNEGEVNEHIKLHFEDFATIRRELVNYGYLSRDPYKGEYKLVKDKLYVEDLEHHTLLKRHATPYLET